MTPRKFALILFPLSIVLISCLCSSLPALRPKPTPPVIALPQQPQSPGTGSSQDDLCNKPAPAEGEIAENSSSLAAITSANAEKLEQLEVLGEGTLETVAISTDGQLIAVGGSAGVSLFDSESQARLRQIQTGFEVYSVDFSPDGEHLAVVGDNCNVYLWNVSDGSLTQTLRGHQWGVSGVSFSPDGKFLATVSWDHTLRVWQTSDGSEVLQEFDQQLSIFNHVAFAPDSNSVAWSTGYPDNAVRIFRLPDGKVIHALFNPVDDNTSVMDITFSPDGELLAIGTMGAGAWVWQIGDARPVHQMESVKDISAMGFSPDGSMLAAASQSDGAQIEFWRTSDWQATGASVVNSGAIGQLRYMPDGNSLISVGEAGLQQWPIDTSTEPIQISKGLPTIEALTIAPDGSFFVAGGRDDNVYVYDVATRTLRDILQGHADNVMAVAIAPDNSRIASSGIDQSIRFWDAATGELLGTWPNQQDWVSALAFSPDGRYLVSADNAVRVWQLSDGVLQHTFDDFMDRATVVAISSDGRLLAAGSNDGGLRIWQMSDGTLMAELQDHGQRIDSVGFSPDGQWLFTGSHDNVFRKWDVKTGSLAGQIDAGSIVWSVAASPDGSVVAAGLANGTLLLIEPETDTVLRVVQQHEWIIKALAFTPDGATLITGGFDDTIRIWGIPAP